MGRRERGYEGEGGKMREGKRENKMVEEEEEGSVKWRNVPHQSIQHQHTAKRLATTTSGHSHHMVLTFMIELA